MPSKIKKTVPCDKSLKLRGKSIRNTIGQSRPRTRLTIRRVNDSTIAPIASNGENRFPTEIENALLEHSQITELAVVGIAGDRWGDVSDCFLRTGNNEPVVARTPGTARDSGGLIPRR